MTATVTQCPFCELRFAHSTEVAQHVAVDHPAPLDEDVPQPVRWRGRVTVPLDPSRPPTGALRTAAALARQAGCAVEVVAVPAPGLPTTAGYLAARRRDLEAEGVAARSTHELAGEPADAIVERAASGATSLLCMASRGRGPIAEATLGSVSAEVVRRSPVPVVLVGPGLLFPGTSIRRIVVGIDGSSIAHDALDAAATLGDRLGVALDLIMAVEPGAPVTDVPEEAALRRSAGHLAPSSVSWDVMHDHDPVRALAARAGGAGDTLIVVGTHGRTGLDRLVLGSVAHGLVRHAGGPVMVVPRDATLDLDRPAGGGPAAAPPEPTT